MFRAELLPTSRQDLDEIKKLDGRFPRDPLILFRSIQRQSNRFVETRISRRAFCADFGGVGVVETCWTRRKLKDDVRYRSWARGHPRQAREFVALLLPHTSVISVLSANATWQSHGTTAPVQASTAGPSTRRPSGVKSKVHLAVELLITALHGTESIESTALGIRHVRVVIHQTAEKRSGEIPRCAVFPLHIDLSGRKVANNCSC